MKKRNIVAVLAFVMFFGVIAFSKRNVMYSADNAVSVYEINYEEETLTIQAAAGDTKVFFASSADSSSWDAVYGEKDSNNRIIMDISWASKASNVTFYIKGDSASTPVKVTLPKQSSTFKASLNTATNAVNFSNLGSIDTVYWRKSVSDTWYALKVYDASSLEAFKEDLERFSQQGITLYFRTAQVIGNASSTGSRPSKEVPLKITKRAAAPSVSVDYSKLSISAKNTMEYKKSTDDEWIPVTGNSLSFSEAVPELLYSASTGAPAVSSVSIDVRTKATQSKVASRTATLEINAQEGLDTRNIEYLYTGSTQLKITIKTIKNETTGAVELNGASTSNPYEYTIVLPDKTLDITTASWTAITSTSAVIITSTKAPEGSVIYIRKKATSSAPASSYEDYVVEKYPTAASLDAAADLNKVKGLDKKLIFTLWLPFKDTEVSSITFAGKSVTHKTSVSDTPQNGKYLATVTITDVSAVEAVPGNIDTELEAVIKLGNGDTIESGVTLYIYPQAAVSGNNITIFKDIACDEDAEITVSLGHKTKSSVTVTAVKVNDKTISFSQADDEDKAYTKIVTIAKKTLDEYINSLTSSQLGNSYHVVIELSNGETITSSITITAKIIAAVTSQATGLGISVSSYKANQEAIAAAEAAIAAAAAAGYTSTVAKVAPIVEDPVISLTIDSILFAKDKSYYIESVTWQGIPIMSTFSLSNNNMSIILSVSKIVSVDLSSTSSYSGPVSIVLKSADKNNEVIITSAYKITVTK